MTQPQSEDLETLKIVRYQTYCWSSGSVHEGLVQSYLHQQQLKHIYTSTFCFNLSFELTIQYQEAEQANLSNLVSTVRLCNSFPFFLPFPPFLTSSFLHPSHIAAIGMNGSKASFCKQETV